MAGYRRGGGCGLGFANIVDGLDGRGGQGGRGGQNKQGESVIFATVVGAQGGRGGWWVKTKLKI